MKAIIDDGYSRTVGIKEQANILPAVEFTYRPFRGSERATFGAEFFSIVDPLERAECGTAMLMDRMEGWNITGPKGEPTTVEVRWLNKLEPNLLQRIIDIILGNVAADYIVGEESTEDDDLKNSSAG